MRRELIGWIFYDFANSAFATTILAVIFNVYFVKVVCRGAAIPGVSVWGYSLAFSLLIIAVISPLLGAMADYTKRKKGFLFVFCYLGALFTCLLYFLKAGMVFTGVLFITVVNICFASGNGFYNSLLPAISSSENFGKVSGLGWAFGYLGGALCLLINLWIIKRPELFGIPPSEDLPVRVGFIVAGMWWALFSIPLFVWVKERKESAGETRDLLRTGWKRVSQTLKKIHYHRTLGKFLISYLLYNDGIETVIVMASVFAMEELNMKEDDIIKCFLMIQFLALWGSLGLGYLADKMGNKRTLQLCLLCWCGIILWAVFIQTAQEFWILAVFTALVLGGSQAISRALFARLTPEEHEAEFFGFFAVSGKFSSILGPLFYGFSRHVFGSSRVAIGSLLFFFIGGLVLLSSLNIGSPPVRKERGDR